MNTQFDYCYTLVPPSGASTELVWESSVPNTTVEVTIQEVCSPWAGCITGDLGDHLIYDQTASFGTAEFSNSAGLAFELAISSPGGCGSNSTSQSCGNVTVLASAAWS
jgi:hypothetical protein